MVRPVAELALIVVGVLIALSADAWWQDRESRASELAYLRAIEEDMRLAAIALRDVAAQDSAHYARADSMLTLLRAGLPPASEETDWRSLVGLYSAPVSVPDGTLQAFVASGGLSFVRSEELRIVLASQSALLRSNLAAIRRIGEQNSANVYDMLRVMESLRFDAREAGVPLSLDMLRRSPALIGTYVVYLTQMRVTLIALRNARRAVEEIHRAVELELADRAT